MNELFSQEEVQMPNKNMKKCTITLDLKEMQIKMTLDAGRVAQVVNHLTGKHEA
jgi:hypothetical protein